MEDGWRHTKTHIKKTLPTRAWIKTHGCSRSPPVRSICTSIKLQKVNAFFLPSSIFATKCKRLFHAFLKFYYYIYSVDNPLIFQVLTKFVFPFQKGQISPMDAGLLCVQCILVLCCDNSPAVSKQPLEDVRGPWRAEDRPLDVAVFEVAAVDFVGTQPLFDPLLDAVPLWETDRARARGKAVIHKVHRVLAEDKRYTES